MYIFMNLKDFYFYLLFTSVCYWHKRATAGLVSELFSLQMHLSDQVMKDFRF